MDSSKLVVKFMIADPARLSAEAAVPVFHGWIQSHAVEGHLLIDVADYSHVPDGPGMVLVAHEGNFYLDHLHGQPGLTYSRKQPLEGSFADRLRFVFATALKACSRLEQDERLGGLRFRTDEVVFRINDRLHAPNIRETFEEIAPQLEAFASKLYGSPVQLEYQPSDKELFEVKLVVGNSPPVGALLDRLATM